MNKVAFLVQRFVRLCDYEVIFFVGSQINDLVGNDGVIRVTLVYKTVRRFHKSVLVNPRIRSQGVDQTDVRTFRSLDRAHTTIMCIVYISYLESGTVS